MKNLLLILALAMASFSASASDPLSLECTGRLDRFIYVASVDPGSDILEVSKLVGTPGGAAGVWAYKNPVRYLLGRGLLNVSGVDRKVHIETLLEIEESWGYRGRGKLRLDGMEIPLTCSVWMPSALME